MGIGRGRDWGSAGDLPDGGVIVGNDAEARRLVTDARRRGEPIPTLGLAGGDLCRTLGGTGDVQRLATHGHTVTCDLGSVLVDGRIHWFTAHLVALHSRLAGRFVVVMNAAFIGSWNLGPRAHPGDGLLDVSDGNLRPSQRIRAVRRLRSGTHLPHPDIATSRVDAFSASFERPVRVLLDGVRVGTARKLAIRVEKDALTVVI
jgi:hypothetical protein